MNLNLSGLFDDVIIREDEPFFIYDNTRPQATLCFRSFIGGVEKAVEEIMKRIRTPTPVLRLALSIDHLSGGDIHHGWLIAFHDGAKGVGKGNGVGKLQGRRPARQE